MIIIFSSREYHTLNTLRILEMKMTKITDKLKEKVIEAKGKVVETKDKVTDTTKEKAKDAKDKVVETKDKVTDTSKDTIRDTSVAGTKVSTKGDSTR